MIYILNFLFAFALFFGGVLYGIRDCKKHYGIKKGADVENEHVGS